MLVLSTLVLFGSGVLLLVRPEQGAILGLHKASFVVWFGAMTVHVLAHALRAGRHLVTEARRRVEGRGYRIGAAVLAVGAGLVVGVACQQRATPSLRG